MKYKNRVALNKVSQKSFWPTRDQVVVYACRSATSKQQFHSIKYSAPDFLVRFLILRRTDVPTYIHDTHVLRFYQLEDTFVRLSQTKGNERCQEILTASIIRVFDDSGSKFL
jgi:hypothetical protein